VEYSEVTVGDRWDLHSGAAEDSYILVGGTVLLYHSLIKHIFPVRQFTEFVSDKCDVNNFSLNFSGLYVSD